MKKRYFLSLVFSLTLAILPSFVTPVFSQSSYNMTLLKNLAEHGTRYSAIWGYTAPNGREYAILGCWTGTSFVDITDSLNIHEVGFVPTIDVNSNGNTWREMKTYSHYAYIVSEVENSGIQIVDLQYLPDSIRYVKKVLLPNHSNTHTISQEGHFLYLNGGGPAFGSGTAVVDLSIDPENPVLRGKWTNLYVHDSRILRDTIYACNITDNRISIIDARNKDSLKSITSFPTTPVIMPHNCAVTPDRKYLYSTDETTAGKLKVWDISNIFDPILVRRYIPPAIFDQDDVHNVEIYGNILIIAYYQAGVHVLDITDKSNPVLIAFYDTEPGTSGSGCWGVYKFPSGKIVASDMTRGLFVLRVQSGQTAVPVANFMPTTTTTVRAGDSFNFLDISSGGPTSRNWTISGPENFTSTLSAPSITFNALGNYTVKLRVSNSLGADSITRVNCIKVIGPAFKPFSFLMPAAFTINTSPTDTSKFTFIWSKTGTSHYFNYKLKLRKGGTTADRIFSSGTNGRDTLISFRKSFLDSLGRELGFTSDSAQYAARIFAYNGSDSLIGTNTLIFTMRTSVGINNITTEIPNEYKLYNNYPNPFNPSTRIKFDLKESGFISMKIYDINGRELRNLLNEKLAAGTYEYDFNAADLPSGIYFYKLETNGYVSTKKMTLIK